MSPAKVLIIRHAEKPDDPSDEHLTLKGRERAAALAPFISTTYPGIVALYASGVGQHSESLRPQETIAPLSVTIGIKVNTSFLKDEYVAMVQEIQNHPSYTNQVVLICWEHQDIPPIAQAFGISDAPQKWPGNRFDLVWILDYTAGTYQLSQAPQLLLDGDLDSVIS